MSSCCQLQVGKNIRSSGSPQEAYAVCVDEDSKVYTQGGQYFIKAKAVILSTYPVWFNPDKVFTNSGTYHRAEETGETSWYSLSQMGSSYTMTKLESEPDLDKCQQLNYDDLPAELKAFSEYAYVGKSLPEAEISISRKLAAAPFDYFLDPVGTVAAHAIVIAGGVAVLIFYSPVEWAIDAFDHL